MTTRAADTADLASLDGTATAALVRDGLLSPSEVTAAAIARIEAVDRARPGAINSVVIDRFERALHEAASVQPQASPLAGVPILVKDAGQELEGELHFNGLAALRDAGHRSPATTPLMTRLRTAGLVVVGRSSCPAFSAGIDTSPPGFEPTRNPWDPSRTAGGSSGGSAAAVAAGLVPIAHGSDATGSCASRRHGAAC